MRTGVFGAIVTALVVVLALLLGAWLVLSAVTGATLVTFRTGSMAPTMPQGAIAVTVPVSAADIETGDVVTVQREAGAMPVTHRVVEVRGPAQATSERPLKDSERELVLKGDDNDTIDVLPYIVSDARRVVVALPQLGAAVMVIQSPPVMGALVLLAGGLTVWAFWPRRPEAAPQEASSAQLQSDVAGRS